jgi:ABC-type antimicrobial peptide transport system permease subunit
VARQRRDIGIRLALGASTGDVRALVLAKSMRFILAGIGGGLVLALIVSRILSSRIWGVSWYDPVTFLGVAIILAFIGFLASYLPSLRATRVDPAVSLRYE